MDPRFATLADLVIDVAREIRIRGAVPGPGVPLNQTQSQVMRYVHGHPGCKASEIADHTGVKRANVSAAITELRELGYLTSRKDEHDGRAVRIDVTPQAVDTLDRLRASWSAQLSTAWGGDKTDLDQVIARLSALLEGLR
ncbi:MarR family winged helix-turn-helix transcriptional regulator [Paractinoplanes globisporus]|uniref:MarR family winged helix-turn-helix transcriptional regulator n=1 Tax=Paractinoplanes globisporus TaxID=113565 RepID=A0ABW6WQI0_9ACTN|nr:MarR family winged helix-turn-helix transcriptional regulator [Actinoplanes globisporus]